MQDFYSVSVSKSGYEITTTRITKRKSKKMKTQRKDKLSNMQSLVIFKSPTNEYLVV